MQKNCFEKIGPDNKKKTKKTIVFKTTDECLLSTALNTIVFLAFPIIIKWNKFEKVGIIHYPKYST